MALNRPTDLSLNRASVSLHRKDFIIRNHMRPERVLHAIKADEGDWRQVEGLRRAESTL
jgi:hypothetical protein